MVTLCAEEVCPVFLGNARRLHWPFEDPAAATGSEKEVLAAFRRVRDQIHEALEEYFLNGRLVHPLKRAGAGSAPTPVSWSKVTNVKGS